MTITQLQFQGLWVPLANHYLSSGGVASVYRMNAKMGLHRKVEQLIPFLDCLGRGNVLLVCHAWINSSADSLIPRIMPATYLAGWCFSCGRRGPVDVPLHLYFVHFTGVKMMILTAPFGSEAIYFSKAWGERAISSITKALMRSP